MLRKFIELISSNPVFAIEERAGLSLALTAKMILDKQIDISELNAENFGVEAAYNYSVPVAYDGGDTMNRVQVFNVHGTMFMYDQFCGPTGMMTLDRQIKLADRSEKIDAIVLDINSPGGQVAYTETLADTIANTQKPVIAWVNQLTASAAYWIASGTDHIMLSGDTAEVGSIGVLISYLDATRYFKDRGFDQVLIKSNLSPDKVKFNFSQPTEDDKNLIATECLDPVANIFHNKVRANRPDIEEHAFTGNVYMGKSVIDMGLADSFGTLEDAILLASDMALSAKKDSKTTTVSLSKYLNKKTA